MTHGIRIGSHFITHDFEAALAAYNDISPTGVVPKEVAAAIEALRIMLKVQEGNLVILPAEPTYEMFEDSYKAMLTAAREWGWRD